MKIGLLIIATNKYISFLDNLLKSADEFFFKNSNYEVKYFVFTNHKQLNLTTDRKINLIHVEHKDWPWMTLGRYEIFSSNEKSFSGVDYLYYCDADMIFCDTVSDEILSDRVATQHPGLFNTRGTPERNPNSLACVHDDENMQYFAGGFNGGLKSEYLKMSNTLSKNIKKDFDNGIIAIWHDESHLNRYFINNPPTKILDPGYCYGESLKPPFHPRLIALDKNHKEVRNNNI
jgi:histo-blood group ABO system transferase